MAEDAIADLGAANAGDTRFSVDHIQSPYGVYEVRTEYIWESGIVQSAVAQESDATDSRILKLSGAYGKKVVTWTATRVGIPPVLPAPVGASGNEVLLSAVIRPRAPDLEASGTTLEYEVSGEYVFALLRPPWYADGIPMGSPPYTTIPKGENVLQAAQFSTQVI